MRDALLDRLAQANPIPEAAVAALHADLQGQTLALPRLTPERRRRRSPRLLVAAALVVGAALIAGPALAWKFGVIDFSSAKPAPARVVNDFDSLFKEGAPAGMDPRVVAGETRRLGDIEGHTLWIAPTRKGGFCYVWSGASGGCDASGTVRLSVSWATGLTPPSSEPLIRIVEGFADARSVDEVEIKLDDHTTLRPRLIWISPPIDAGLYYYRAPKGRAIQAVVALKDGEVVAHERAPGAAALPGPDPGSPVPRPIAWPRESGHDRASKLQCAISTTSTRPERQDFGFGRRASVRARRAQGAGGRASTAARCSSELNVTGTKRRKPLRP
jgi:hypothetical protein